MVDHCSLFGTLGWVIQGILAALCFVCLFFKHQLERPRRDFNTFVLDISKQGFSSVLIHVMNLYLAYLFNEIAKDGECLWYFINLTVDCTLGGLLNYALLKMAERAAQACNISSFKSGEYRSEEGSIMIGAWFGQLVVWCLIVCLSKAVLLASIYFASSVYIDLAHFILDPMRLHADLELLFVMVLVPCGLNCLLMWFQDNFLKAGSNKQSLLLTHIELDANNI